MNRNSCSYGGPLARGFEEKEHVEMEQRWKVCGTEKRPWTPSHLFVFYGTICICTPLQLPDDRVVRDATGLVAT